MTINNIISALPEQAKRSVLFSVVGSLNASLIGTANNIVSKLERDGCDFREIDVRDVEQLMSGMAGMEDTLANARLVERVANGMRVQLQEVSNDDEAGLIAESIKFMSSGKTREFDAAFIAEIAAAAGIEGIDPKMLNAANRANKQRSAERIAANQGAIEWLIGNVLTKRVEDPTGVLYGDEIEADVEELSAEHLERLHGTVEKALVRARDDAFLGVLNRDRRYSLGDLPLIAAAIKELDTL